MAIQAPNFNVQQLSPADVFAQFDQPQQQPGMVDQILQGIFSQHRRGIRDGAAPEEELDPVEIPTMADIMNKMIFGAHDLEVPGPSGTIGPVAPPVTSARQGMIR